MKIEIPPETETFVQSRAQAAGFDNIRDYVLNLILEDDTEHLDMDQLI